MRLKEIKRKSNIHIKGNFQKKSYSCGAWAFKHALECLGLNITIQDAKYLCNTTSYIQSAWQNLTFIKLVKNHRKALLNFYLQVGTDENGIKKGLGVLKIKFTEYFSYSDGLFLRFLDRSLLRGSVILFINYDQDIGDSGHWVACISKINAKYVIVDSAPFSGRPRQLYSVNRLLERFWWKDEKEDYYCFYGIALYL